MNKTVRYGLLVIAIVIVLSGILYSRLAKRSSDTANSLFRLQSPPAKEQGSTERVLTIAENLDTPWGLALLPDNKLLVTERKGTVSVVDLQSNQSTDLGSVPNVVEQGEGGLMGVALHPDFRQNKSIYFYYTYQNDGNNTRNRIVRMTLNNNRLTDEQIIRDNIPGASNHNGGRIHFGPDKLLYIGTGDAQDPSQAQGKASLAGKVLRVTDEGKPASGNPFNSPVYSYGHRNVQGIAWDSSNQLWVTEHGRSGVRSGLDEVNRIESGKNYGWPDIEGDETRAGMETAEKNSGANDTWAPAGAAFVANSMFFGGLRGQALYEAVIENNQVIELKVHLKNEYGRIRDVISDGKGMLYVTTSNNDGRGNPASNDDRILKINPSKL